MPGATKTDTKADVTSIKSQLQIAEQGRLVQSWLYNALNTNGNSPRPTERNDEGGDEDENDEFDVEQDEQGLGLSYVTPTTANTPKDRQSMSTNDKLRKQLLGHSKSVHQRPSPTHGQIRPGHLGTGSGVIANTSASGNGSGNGPGKLQSSKPRPGTQRGRSADDSGDDSDGRTVATTTTKNPRSREERKHKKEEKKKSTSSSSTAGTAGTESVSSGISTNPGSTRSASHEPNSGNSEEMVHKTTSKRRSTNYLDEILAQRSNKKKKKSTS